MTLKLGQTAWMAKATHHSKVEQACPDCFGKRYLTVILGDTSQVTIDCSTCAVGYDRPRGYVLVDQYAPAAELVTVLKVETELVNGEEVALYSGEGLYRVPESELFECKLNALDLAEKKAKKLVEEATARLQRKEKDTRTWAWHVTYHRRCIKQAQRELEYHSSKLSVSLSKKKEGL